MPAPAVEIALRTDPGRDPDKQVNEDAGVQIETPLGLLAIVCDGMGGHAGGKEAATLAVETIAACVSGATGVSARDALRAAIEEANRRVWSMPTAEHGLRPGSTVVAILLHDGGADVAHVGDSRVYLVHAGAISQVTRDHSMVQEMVDRNLIRAEEAANHPDANKILRALGIAPEVDVEVRPTPVPYVTGDVFVLCSDGLSDLVAPSDILQIAGGLPPAQAAGQLVDLANARGGHDNITALVVRMKETANVRDAPTIVKTMQITAHDAPPAQVPTEVGAPGATVMTLPAPHASNAPAPAPVPSSPQVNTQSMPAPASPSPAPPMTPLAAGDPPLSEKHARSNLVPLIAGIVLAVIALGLLGAFVWSSMHPPQPHKTVPIVETSATGVRPPVHVQTPEEEDASAAPAVIPVTPPLVTANPRGNNDPCARAAAARERHLPEAVIRRFEAQCAADAGR